MSDLKVWVEDTEFGEDFEVSVSPADLVAAVRRGVESGTIKGVKREWYCERQKRCVDTDGYQCRTGYNEAVAHPECGWHLVIPEQRVEWCETHDSPLIHEDEVCDYALENNYCVTPCRTVVGGRLLVDPPTEEER